MNVQMVVYTEIIYALTVTALEVPSGILADKFGRKRVLAICGVLSAAEFALLFFASNFWMFALVVFLSGTGKALSSGSENALLYDSLLFDGRQEDFEKHLGRLSAIDFTGSVIAAVSGGILANYFNLEFNYILSFISMCFAFLVTVFLKEPPKQTLAKGETAGESETAAENETAGESETAGALQYASRALQVFKNNPLVFIYCLTGAVLGSCIIYLDEFWQIILDNIGVSVVFFGAVSAASLVLRIPGSLIAYKLKEKFSYRKILTCTICFCAVGYAAIFLANGLLCLVPMMLLFVVSGIADPLVSGFLHRHTESGIRATVESFSSLFLRVVSVGVGLIFGYVSSNISIFAGVLSFSFICAAYLAVFRIFGAEKPFS
jgi:MFS family permease